MDSDNLPDETPAEPDRPVTTRRTPGPRASGPRAEPAAATATAAEAPAGEPRPASSRTTRSKATPSSTTQGGSVEPRVAGGRSNEEPTAWITGAEAYSSDLRSAEPRIVEPRSPESRRPDPREAEPRPSDSRPSDSRQSDPRQSDSRNADPRNAETRAIDARRLDARAGATRTGGGLGSGRGGDARSGEVRFGEPRMDDHRGDARSVAETTVPTNIYRARRPAVAVFLIIPALAIGFLLVRGLAMAGFGQPFVLGGVIASALGLASLPLLVSGLYGLITGAAHGAEQWGFRVWARPPLAYLIVGIAFVLAAAVAAG